MKRRDAYHSLAEKRVRTAIRLGYDRMYGPFNIVGTATIPLPKLDTVDAYVVAEVMADCQADLDAGAAMVKQLRTKILEGFGRVTGYQKTILVRKFGRTPFRHQEVFEAPLMLNRGAGESDENDQDRLEAGQAVLRDMRIDIAFYEKVWAQMSRMSTRRRL